MNERVKSFFKQNVGYLIVAFVCVVYVLTAFLTIDASGKTVAQIIGDGAVAFFLGLFINRIFDLQGMLSGDREPRVQSTKEEHGAIVLRISPYIDKLDAWCVLENERNYKTQRTKILARVGLKYEECFDENGVAKNWTPDAEKLKNKMLRKVELRKNHGFLKAVNLKLTSLSAGELTSEGGKQQDPFYFGRTKAQYETQEGLGDIVSKLGTAMIFGYYGVTLIENFNYANLIWMTLQVGLFLVMGVIRMYQAYNFVTDEFRGRVIKKIDNLQKFENYIKATEKTDALRTDAEKTLKKTEGTKNE